MRLLVTHTCTRDPKTCNATPAPGLLPQVMTAKRDGELPKLLRRVARDATEELGAYAAGRRNRWLDAWAKGGPLPPLRP